MKEYIILMADIIGSRKQEQSELMAGFKEIVQAANAQAGWFVSPLTITLGDEFQGVLTDPGTAIRAILFLEEMIVSREMAFKLRYVIVEGLIETPVNREIAYGMLGDGLTRARQYLTNLKKEESRFFFWLKDQAKKKALNNVFMALQDVLDDWRPEKDFYLVREFLAEESYRKVADKLGKEPSLMWKRRKSLRINTYLALKETSDYIAYA
ncbi:hypothetical protein FO440_23790 [Mucilaginibacter corticis]|uniref:SatD family (SatD) n=1 Tax=Mucilaginibacter corticis TaxID=2597670 RepID=A0A556M7Q5_9SPHI|nr:SatD family protein [Mucilaginibacter corticis]TSJ35943.1 hypothetical protein FO440_23790 [Mucilaginibacter corticis]